MIDAKAFGAEIAGIIKSQVDPLRREIEDLRKALNDLPPPAHGKDGKDSDPRAVAEMAAAQIKGDLDELRGAIAAIPAPAELPDIGKMIADAVTKEIAAIPTPKDGKDGESVLADDILPALEKRVDDFLATIPMPKDGKDGADGERGPQGEKGADGRDGVGLAGALIDRDGELSVTLTNGVVQRLGPIVGKDGDSGKDGAPGCDGADGLGFDDMNLEHDEHGRAVAKFVRGDVVKSIVLPGIVDRGPFRAGEDYQKGDAVSYGGSLWIAQDRTGERPDGGAGWRLAVKRGRDGKDGELKPVADPKPVKVT